MSRSAGYKHSEETRKKISASKIGHRVSGETRQKIRETLKDTHVSWNRGLKGKGICRPNSGSFKKGITPWIKGRHHTKATKKKMSVAAWNGGRTRRYGYVLLYRPKHRDAICGYVREHRIVMEQFIGRPLDRKEVVHHVNGIKDDNRIENLSLLASEAVHRKLHNHLKGFKCA